MSLVDPNDAYNLFLRLLKMSMDSACSSKKARMNHRRKVENKCDAERSRLSEEFQTDNNRYVAASHQQRTETLRRAFQTCYSAGDGRSTDR